MIITTPFLQLEFIKEIGWTHMRILEGVSTVIQLGGLLSRLCKMVRPPAQLQTVLQA